MAQYDPDSYGRYKPSDIKKAIKPLFTYNEFLLLIKKINQCNPNTFINHSFQTEANCVKIYDYLTLWRSKYWEGEDMKKFLCGMIGNIRKNQEKLTQKTLNQIADKMNTDVTNVVGEYIKNGGKRKKTIKKKIRRNRRKKTRKI